MAHKRKYREGLGECPTPTGQGKDSEKGSHMLGRDRVQVPCYSCFDILLLNRVRVSFSSSTASADILEGADLVTTA